MVVVGSPVDLLHPGESVVFHVPYGVFPILDVCFHWRCCARPFLSISYQFPILDVEETDAFKSWCLDWKLMVTGVVYFPVPVHLVTFNPLALFQP